MVLSRKPPIRHTVRSHKRGGKPVKSFERGKGQKPQRSRRIVGKVNPPTIQYKKLTKAVLRKIFNTEDVSSKRTTGPKYDRIVYRVYTPERRIVIWEYRWREWGRMTGKKDFSIRVGRVTSIKEGTPEYKSLLKKHGSLIISDGTVYEPEFEYSMVDEPTLRKHIESVV